MSLKYFMPMCVTKWSSLEGEVMGVKTSIKPPDGSRSFGFIQVFESREDAADAFPDASIVELQTPRSAGEGER